MAGPPSTYTLSELISLDDVLAASQRLEGVAHRTPVLTSRSLDEATGAERVLLKAEHLQRVGAFKFRGAYNAVASLRADERERGVATVSSGNHAQAVALAAPGAPPRPPPARGAGRDPDARGRAARQARRDPRLRRRGRPLRPLR